ncbi:hypothetical protein ES703_93776 [subsurface metagenome]
MRTMKVDNRRVLIAIIIVSLLLFPAVALTSGALRIVLALPFILFFPGYTLLSALFPKRGSLGGVERIAYSFGLSIAVTILIGVILNYTPWGINLYPSLISVTLFIITTTIVAWYRQGVLPPDQRFSIAVNISLARWGQMAGLDKVLYTFLAVAIMIALGSIGYVMAVPKQEQKFTEFYILGIDGSAQNYPKQVVLGQPVELIIGIVNHEGVVISYRVDIRINNTRNKEVETAALADEETWQEVVSFIPQGSGLEQKVEFWLYKNDQAEPCFETPLHLYIDVIEPPPAS